MATKSKRSRKASVARRRTKPLNAIALLKADHRKVEGWFAQFGKSRSSEKKQRLAVQICAALRAHTAVEEEIFYPAFIEATGDKDIHHEAIVEHAGAKQLIAQIQSMSPDDDYFEAKVTVLSEMIKHHVKEEEQPKGMFSEASKSAMNLEELGQQIAARKKELEAESKSG